MKSLKTFHATKDIRALAAELINIFELEHRRQCVRGKIKDSMSSFVMIVDY